MFYMNVKFKKKAQSTRNVLETSVTGASAGGGVTNPTNQAQHTITGGATAGAAAAGGGPAAAGGVLFPGAQGSSMVTLNTVPANPHQLPSALVLPSGHVIPVVSNPQLLTANHGGGGLMSVAPGGSGGLTSGSAGTTGHIQLQQMGGGAGTSQVNKKCCFIIPFQIIAMSGYANTVF